ncbi:hypothetical protein PQX77_010278 [Marasmius sp. AFHP31]|nr:hypothetical protein PQX77_010278 [Marasmius sp. AFHP31]
MLAVLPAELVLAVLSSLTIPVLHSLQLVSKEFNQFIRANESSIYHGAAVVHGLIASTAIGIDQLENGGPSYRILDGINGSWKVFCQRRFQLEKSWRGKAPSKLVSYSATGTSVHRIKVDEKNGFIIASTGFWDPPENASGPSLIVSDMKNPEKVLWSLPSTYVKQYAHIEYENGFLIFDRLSGQKEVWRLASLTDPHPPPAGEDVGKLPIPYPQKDQLSVSLVAAAEYTHTYPRGHFVPHALLQMPRRTRAFRFVYPTLLVGGFDHAFCFDVPSRQLAQTVNPTQTPTIKAHEEQSADSQGTTLQPLGELNYVEVSRRHVFICGGNSLRVFSRETGGCVFDLPSTLRSYGHRIIRVLGVGKDSTYSEVAQDRAPSDRVYFGPQSHSWSLIGVDTEVGESAVARLKTVEVPPTPEDHRRVLDEFGAVHVSSCGNHLVAMLRGSSRLVLIKNFLNIPFISDRKEYTKLQKESMIEVQLGTPFCVSQYLAFDRGKIVAVSSAGVFILDANKFFFGPSPPSLPAQPPGTFAPSSRSQDQLLVQACRIPEFNDFVNLSQISCVQISDCGIYLTWDPFRMRVNNGRWTVLPRKPRTITIPRSGSSTSAASRPTGHVEGSEADDDLPPGLRRHNFNPIPSHPIYIDPETDPLEVDEWVSASDEESVEQSDSSDSDGEMTWNTFVDVAQVSHHTRGQQRDTFFFYERVFRVLMREQGRHRVLPDGDLMVIPSRPDIQVGEILDRDSTVCGVNFAAWD